ncbi:MAG: hypothetical protein O9322_05630 [Beijerinckiaceae bacterium]|nr:hypothetical protein [Beijerinckiaceae bacterium]MCZ8299002.1 hypothetical protein [Beijerinckiaceae bacterium]
MIVQQFRTLREREEGFVLLSVLVLTSVIAGIALALSLATRDDAREMKLHLDLTKARLHADNALVRGIAALGDPADPLHGVLLQPGGRHIFRFNGVDVRLSVEHESGKIDLNRADPAFILSALQLLAPEAADAMHARIMALRADGVFIEDVGTLLSPAQAFEPVAGRIERVFTVATGARGIAVHLSTPEIMRAIPGLLPEELELLALDRSRAGANLSPVLVKYQAYSSPARPIYTLRATVQDKSLPPLRRKVVFALGHIPVRRNNDLAVLAWRGEVWE